MSVVTPRSYEHPRRLKPLASSNDNSSYRGVEENLGGYKKQVAQSEDSFNRLERMMNEKFEVLFSRLDKCSELSVASSRAVAAISSQFEEFKEGVDKKVNGFTESLNELRVSSTRVCAESQNLTMSALEECCGELSRQVQQNSKDVLRCSELISANDREWRSVANSLNETASNFASELELLSAEVEAAKDVAEATSLDMRVIAEESVNSGISDLTTKLARDMDALGTEWKQFRSRVSDQLNNHEQVNHLVSDQIRESSASLSSELEARVRDILLPTALSRSRKEIDVDIEQLTRAVNQLITAANTSNEPTVSETLVRKLASDIVSVQDSLTSFTTQTIPSLYKEVDTRIAHAELGSQQQSLDLLKQFATELEFDIDRMVELIHAVFVQAHLPMPSGTAGSWKRFRELMFEKDATEGVRTRRPILPESLYQPTPRGTRLRSFKPPGRP